MLSKVVNAFKDTGNPPGRGLLEYLFDASLLKQDPGIRSEERVFEDGRFIVTHGFTWAISAGGSDKLSIKTLARKDDAYDPDGTTVRVEIDVLHHGRKAGETIIADRVLELVHQAQIEERIAMLVQKCVRQNYGLIASALQPQETPQSGRPAQRTSPVPKIPFNSTGPVLQGF